MLVIVDSSVWIAYFRQGDASEKLEQFIDEDMVATNDLILAELIPPLKLRNHKKLVKLLFNITRLDLSIRWDEIIHFQFKCLKKGVNGIGIPDLIIAQNARQHGCSVFSLDKHFRLMKDIIGFRSAD